MELRFSESKISYWAGEYTKRQRKKDPMKAQKEQYLVYLKSKGNFRRAATSRKKNCMI